MICSEDADICSDQTSCFLNCWVIDTSIYILLGHNNHQHVMCKAANKLEIDKGIFIGLLLSKILELKS